MEKLEVEDQSVPNTHGGAPFVVKVQLNSYKAGGAMWAAADTKGILDLSIDDATNVLIYDRQRTFRVTASSDTGEPGPFTDVAHLVKEKGYKGLKLFCWAIRSGDSTVDVCIDRLPEWQNW
jgi:hypothetical protein